MDQGFKWELSEFLRWQLEQARFGPGEKKTKKPIKVWHTSLTFLNCLSRTFVLHRVAFKDSSQALAHSHQTTCCAGEIWYRAPWTLAFTNIQLFILVSTAWTSFYDFEELIKKMKRNEDDERKHENIFFLSQLNMNWLCICSAFIFSILCLI